VAKKLKVFIRKAGIVSNDVTSSDGIYEMYSEEWANTLLKSRIIREYTSPWAERFTL
jgi:hypothetical protein